MNTAINIPTLNSAMTFIGSYHTSLTHSDIQSTVPLKFLKKHKRTCISQEYTQIAVSLVGMGIEGHKNGSVFLTRLVCMPQTHSKQYSPFLSADNQLLLVRYDDENILPLRTVGAKPEGL